MLRRLALTVLLASCGPAVPQDADHPASAQAAEAPAPALATALTGDPAPPPDEVDEDARTFAADGDEGVTPPVLGIAVHQEGAPLPSRETGPADDHGGHGEHRDHAGHP